MPAWIYTSFAGLLRIVSINFLRIISPVTARGAVSLTLGILNIHIHSTIDITLIIIAQNLFNMCRCMIISRNDHWTVVNFKDYDKDNKT